jgi:hypothetical protein
MKGATKVEKLIEEFISLQEFYREFICLIMSKNISPFMAFEKIMTRYLTYGQIIDVIEESNFEFKIHGDYFEMKEKNITHKFEIKDNIFVDI